MAVSHIVLIRGRIRAELLIAFAMILAAACTSSPTGGQPALKTPSPRASPTAIATTSPTPAAALLCRLPIDRGMGAFVDIPANLTGTGIVDTVSDDPTSDVKLPDGEARAGLSYNWTFKRWLPVPYKWVVPDESRYAYTDSQARIHLVNLSASSDSAITQSGKWGVYGLTADAIYAGQRDPTRQPSLLGLWRIPLTGGAPQQLASQGTWLVIGGGAAWSVVQSDPAPRAPAVPENSVGFTLMRLDLQTGQTAIWYTSSGGRFHVVAADASGRAILAGVDAPRIWVVTAAGAGQATDVSSIVDAMADSHGVWYEDPMSIAVYLISGSVPRYMGQYGYGLTIKFAGPCQ